MPPLFSVQCPCRTVFCYQWACGEQDDSGPACCLRAPSIVSRDLMRLPDVLSVFLVAWVIIVALRICCSTNTTTVCYTIAEHSLRIHLQDRWQESLPVPLKATRNPAPKLVFLRRQTRVSRGYVAVGNQHRGSSWSWKSFLYYFSM